MISEGRQLCMTLDAGYDTKVWSRRCFSAFQRNYVSIFNPEDGGIMFL
jgi:hypothetical protein